MPGSRLMLGSGYKRMPPSRPRGRLWGAHLPVFTKPASSSGPRAHAFPDNRRGACSREFNCGDGAYRPPCLSGHPEQELDNLLEQMICEHHSSMRGPPHSGCDRRTQVCRCGDCAGRGQSGFRSEDQSKFVEERRSSPNYFSELMRKTMAGAEEACRCVPNCNGSLHESMSPCESDTFRHMARPKTSSDVSASSTGKQVEESLFGSGSLTAWHSKQPKAPVAKQVSLRKWFLIRCSDEESKDLTDSTNPRVAVGGFYISESFERQVVRTTMIMERIEKCRLRTRDGVEVRLIGCIDDETSLANGFSVKVVHHFLTGFPFVWKHFLLLFHSQNSADVETVRTGAHARSSDPETTGQKSSGSDGIHVTEGAGVSQIPVAMPANPSTAAGQEAEQCCAGQLNSQANNQENEVCHGGHIVREGEKGASAPLEFEYPSAVNASGNARGSLPECCVSYVDNVSSVSDCMVPQEQGRAVINAEHVSSEAHEHLNVCRKNEVNHLVEHEKYMAPIKPYNLRSGQAFESNRVQHNERLDNEEHRDREGASATDTVPACSARNFCEQAEKKHLTKQQKRRLKKRNKRNWKRQKMGNGGADALEVVQATSDGMSVPLEEGTLPVIGTPVSACASAVARDEVDRDCDKGTEATPGSSVQQLEHDAACGGAAAVGDLEPVAAASGGLEQHLEVACGGKGNDYPFPEICTPEPANEPRNVDGVVRGGVTGDLAKGTGLAAVGTVQDSEPDITLVTPENPPRRMTRYSERIRLAAEVLSPSMSVATSVQSQPLVKSRQKSVRRMLSKEQASAPRSQSADQDKTCSSNAGDFSELEGASADMDAETQFCTPVERDDARTEKPEKTVGNPGSLARSKTHHVTADKDQEAASSGSRSKRSKTSMIPPPLPEPLVSKEVIVMAYGLKTSRAGRLLVPPLAYWRNQTVARDKDGGIIAIIDGFEDKGDRDTGCFNFEPPREKKAVRLQKKLLQAAKQLER